jgi:hypothetical protein
MVTANGHRSYVVQYRAAGQSRRMYLKDGLTLRRVPIGGPFGTGWIAALRDGA